MALFARGWVRHLLYKLVTFYTRKIIEAAGTQEKTRSGDLDDNKMRLWALSVFLVCACASSEPDKKVNTRHLISGGGVNLAQQLISGLNTHIQGSSSFPSHGHINSNQFPSHSIGGHHSNTGHHFPSRPVSSGVGIQIGSAGHHHGSVNHQGGSGIGIHIGSSGVHIGTGGVVPGSHYPGTQYPGSHIPGRPQCKYYCSINGYYRCCSSPQTPTQPQVRPGFCPPVRPTCPNTRFRPPNECYSDLSCAHSEKCCYDTCLEHRTCKRAEIYG
ncbi:uncharacterized protein LOC143018487 [Oratosquilla oratoria]|uniref:uncharacterized protein LOC143018487 n=1 Tax=Oratosquilla oratoria TaxID=337810 RepID=UPI003F77581E